MPAADVALVAELAGYDPVEWVSRAVAAQHEGTPKGIKLQSALKKALAATGAVIVSSGAAASTIGHEAIGYLIRCIEWLSNSDPKTEARLSSEGDRTGHAERRTIDRRRTASASS